LSTTTTNTIPEAILEWWQIALYAVTMVVGFILGTARQRWTQEQLQIKVAALESRLTALEQSSGIDSRTLLVVQTELTHIRSALVEIKAKLEA
jgi:hypothetical protein